MHTRTQMLAGKVKTRPYARTHATHAHSPIHPPFPHTYTHACLHARMHTVCQMEEALLPFVRFLLHNDTRCHSNTCLLNLTLRELPKEENFERLNKLKQKVQVMELTGGPS